MFSFSDLCLNLFYCCFFLDVWTETSDSFSVPQLAWLRGPVLRTVSDWLPGCREAAAAVGGPSFRLAVERSSARPTDGGPLQRWHRQDRSVIKCITKTNLHNNEAPKSDRLHLISHTSLLYTRLKSVCDISMCNFCVNYLFNGLSDWSPLPRRYILCAGYLSVAAAGCRDP